jgi:nucleoside-diphosphate-sugar epimerase
MFGATQEETDMSEQIVIFGYGAVGKATAERLVAASRTVRVAQRRRPKDLVSGAEFVACDIADAQAVARAVQGATQVVAALGLPYSGKEWRRLWPTAMANLLAACQAAKARLVFVDNLYMYGPQTAPLREDMPLTPYGVKPAVRSDLTRQWMAASQAGDVLVAALRAPDFYGPGVGLSHIGDVGFGALAKNKRMILIIPPDIPHAFAYVPDVARAVVTLLDAADDAYGQAWHVPCAPSRTPREILSIGAKALGVAPKISALPLWLLPILGLASPTLAEFAEMRFLLDRPYHVDGSKFAKRFWSDFTPIEVGAAQTAASFKAAASSASAR